MTTSPFAMREKEAGGTTAEYLGVRLPTDYGDPVREYRAVRGGAGLIDLSFRGLLELSGGERLRWLNGQITNDAKTLRAGEGVLAAALTAKGHILSDLAVYGLEASVWIDLNRHRAPAVQAAFECHIIADDVAVADVSDRYARLMVAGPEAARLLAETAGSEVAYLPAWHHREARIGGVPVRVIASPWLSLPGFELVAPAEAAGQTWRALLDSDRAAGLRPVGTTALEWLRVEAGRPWFGVDFDEQNLLLESLARDHVSFTKGCYIGQEVVSRAEHQGHLNKRLCGLFLSGETVPARGATIISGDRKVGVVTSAVRSPAMGRGIALGMLRRECWDLGTKVQVAIDSRRLDAEVTALPFVST